MNLSSIVIYGVSCKYLFNSSLVPISPAPCSSLFCLIISNHFGASEVDAISSTVFFDGVFCDSPAPCLRDAWDAHRGGVWCFGPAV